MRQTKREIRINKIKELVTTYNSLQIKLESGTVMYTNTEVLNVCIDGMDPFSLDFGVRYSVGSTCGYKPFDECSSKNFADKIWRAKKILNIASNHPGYLITCPSILFDDVDLDMITAKILRESL